ARSDVDGLGIAVSDGDGSRRDPCHHASEPVDLFDFVAERPSGAAQCQSWCVAERDRHGSVWADATVSFGRDRVPEKHQECRMKFGAVSAIACALLMSACVKPRELPE